MTRDVLPRGLLLDLDDTIVDDTTAVDTSWEEACRQCMPDEGYARVLAAITDVRNWYWADAERHRVGRLDMGAARRTIVAMALRWVGRHDDGLAAAIAAQYGHLRDVRLELLPGAVDAIRWFRSVGCRTALLTNGAGAAQRRKIARFGLEELFDLICIEGELGFGKPDDRIYHHALRQLEIAPNHAWMVGDNLVWDIEPAQRLGLRAIWVDSRRRGIPESAPCIPDRVVRRLLDLCAAGVARAGLTPSDEWHA